MDFVSPLTREAAIVTGQTDSSPRSAYGTPLLLRSPLQLERSFPSIPSSSPVIGGDILTFTSPLEAKINKSIIGLASQRISNIGEGNKLPITVNRTPL